MKSYQMYTCVLDMGSSLEIILLNPEGQLRTVGSKSVQRSENELFLVFSGK